MGPKRERGTKVKPFRLRPDLSTKDERKGEKEGERTRGSTSWRTH